MSSEHSCPAHGARVQLKWSTLMQGLVKLLNAKDKIATKSELNKSREKIKKKEKKRKSNSSLLYKLSLNSPECF